MKKEGVLIYLVILLVLVGTVFASHSFTGISANITTGLNTNWSVTINSSEAFDASPWFTNDTFRFNFSWLTADKTKGTIENNKTNTLPNGVYYLNITAVGTIGDYLSATYQWTLDAAAPTFNETITNATVEYYTESFALNVNASDPNNVSAFFLNDTTRFKINNSGYLENNSFLSLGNNFVIVFVNDSYNNINQSTFHLIVADTISPTFTHGLPNNSIASTDPLAIDINATDAHSTNYYVNDTSNFKINGSGYLENNTVLSGGSYYVFEIIVNDTSNNTDTLFYNLSVTGSDTTAPSLSQVILNRSLVNTSTFTLDINATDSSGISNYTINDTTNFKINNSGYLENNTKLVIDEYFLNITINDTLNNVAYFYFNINITEADLTAPTLSQAIANRTLAYITNLAIDVNATDSSGISNYSINDTTNFKINDSGYLENNTNLTINGVYFLNISVNDTENNIASFHFNVNVTDILAPSFTQIPVNRTLEFYQDSLAINVNATDVEGIDKYSINYTEDFSINQSGFLKNTTDIGKANYYINVSVNDTYNRISSFTLQFNVSDTLGPSFNEIPPNQTITLGDSISIQINITEPSGLDSWADNDTDSFDVNDSGYFNNTADLSVGTYYVNISATDQDQNVGAFTFQVTVTQAGDATINVNTCAGLKTAINDSNATINITGSFNCAGTAFNNWDDTNVSEFNYSFHGNNYTISNLTIVNTRSSATLYTGLIPKFSTGEFKDIIFDNLTITSASQTGGLFGDVFDSNISNVIVQGKITHTSTHPNTGGIASTSNKSILRNVTFNGTIVSDDNSNGGLIGRTLPSSFMTNIVNSYVYVDINSSNSNNNNIGGFVGNSYSTNISHVYGNVVIKSFGVDQGGVLGRVRGTSHINNVNISVYLNNSGGAANDGSGGLVGAQDNNIILIISNSTVTGTIIGNDFQGGLIGIAKNNLFLNTSSFIGDMTTGKESGGIIGEASSNGTVFKVYAKGNLTGSFQLGGLVGDMFNLKLNNSYAHMNITSNYTAGDPIIGGLVGNFQSGTLKNNYYVGNITNDTNAYVGAVIGKFTSGTYSNNFYDNQTTIINGGIGNATQPNASANAIGKNTADMRTRSTFTTANWDFTSNWLMNDSSSYPFLNLGDPVVDTTVPTFTQIPSNVTLEYFTQSLSIDFNATDETSFSKYFINDTTNFNISQEGILINMTTFAVDSFFINVSINDSSDNVNSLIFLVTVNDTTVPSFTQIPANRSIDIANSLAIDINATDLTNVSTFYLNDSNYKINNSGYFENNTNLSAGLDYVTVFVNDTYNNTNTFLFLLTAIETIVPTFDQYPANITIEFYSQNLNINVNASDASGINKYFVNDTTNFNISQDGILTNKTNLSILDHYVNISVNDTYDNVKSLVLNINVSDTTSPVFTQSLINRTINIATSIAIQVNATDVTGVTWTVNDSTNFKINSTGYLENNTLLSVSPQDVMINATDSQSNTAYLHFQFNITDSESPLLDVTSNVTVEYYSTNVLIDFNASDIGQINQFFINTSKFSINSSGHLINSTFLNVDLYFINVSVNDTSNNVNSTPYLVTINDTTPPTFTQGVANRSNDFYDSLAININATDFTNISTFYLNDTNFKINNSGYFENNTNLSVDTYYLIIFVNDTYNNTVTKDLLINVTDVSAPTFDQIPSNLTLEYFSASLLVDINATDPSGLSQFFINDTTNFKINNSGVLENNTALSVQVWFVNVSVNDTDDNVSSLNFLVNVSDTTNPSFSQIPSNKSQEYTVALAINVNATDDSGIGNWSINDTTNFKINDSGYLENNTVLQKDVYYVNITVNDTYNNANSFTFNITVTDSVAPTFDEIPSNVTLEYFIGFSIDINATDNSLNLYTVNDTTRFNISQDGILINKTFMNVDDWYVNISVNDTSNNVESLTFKVIVNDTTVPSFTQIVVNRSIDFYANTAINVNATDLTNISTFYLNTSDFKINNSGYFENNSNLSVDSYYIIVFVNDSYNNTAIMDLQINITDDSSPTFDQIPSNISLEYYINSLLVDINASDPSGLSQFFINDTTNFKINNSGVLENNTAITIQEYYVNVSVNDTDNKVSSLIFFVNVSDSTIPSFTEVIQNRTLGTSNALAIDVNATDASNISTFYVNDTTYFKINNSGYLENNTNLTVDTHYVLISVNDTYNNTALSYFKVNVTAINNPTFDEIPSNVTLEYGSTLSIDINATDGAGISRYFLNDSTNFNITFDGVLKNKTVLHIDSYYVNVSVNDTDNNVVSLTFYAFVNDTSAPTFTEIVSNRTRGNLDTIAIDINATDVSNISQFYLNDTTNFKINNSGYLENNTNLSVISHYVLVSVNDTYNLTSHMYFQLNITAVNGPTFDEIPSNVTLEYYSASLYMDFNATDPSGVSTYFINSSNFNISTTGIMQNITTLSVDNYYVNVSVNDTNNFVSSLNFWVNVSDTTIPTFNQTIANRSLDIVDRLTINVNASDVSGISNYSINDTTNFRINDSGFLQNNTNLTVDTYYISILVNDTYNNTALNYLLVNISETNVPSFSPIPSNVTLEYYTGSLSININATDPSGISTYYINDSNNFNISFEGILINTSFLNVNNYYLNVTVNDTSNLLSSINFLVNVTDTTAPTLDQTIQNRTLDQLVDLAIDVNGSDFHNISTYYINDTTNFKINNSGYLENNTVLQNQVHYLNIAINDSFNNTINTLFLLTVDDTTSPTFDEIPSNISLEFKTNYLSIDVNASDYSSLSQYFINDTTNFNISQDGVLINKTLFNVDLYFVNVSVNDSSNNVNSLTFFANVSDTTGPSFTETIANRTITQLTALTIDVNATDLTAVSNYSINDTTNFKINNSGYLENNTVLVGGVFYLNISINDTYDNTNYNLFVLTVTDSIIPTIDDTPVNVTLEYFTDTLIADFNASDYSGISRFFINDTSNFNITFDGTLKNKTVLSTDRYYVNVSVNDTVGNVNSKTFELNVSDTILPTLNETPLNHTVEYYFKNVSLKYNASDLSGISTFTVSDTTNFNISFDGLLTNVTRLASGIYIFSITFNDTQNNTKSLTTNVTISDTKSPWFDTYTNLTIEYDQSFSYDINATDPSNLSQFIINETTNFNMTFDGVLTNNTRLNTDTYYILLTVNDTNNNTNTSIITVFVNDTESPTMTMPQNITIEYYTTSLSVDANASDSSNLSIFYINDTSNFNMTFDGVLINSTRLNLDTYYISILVNDTFGNVNSSVYFVNVTDTIKPTFDQLLVNRTIELFVDSLSLDVNASDTVNVSLYSVNDTKFSINSSGFLINSTVLSYGNHHINVSVNDTSNNTNNTILYLFVNDSVAPLLQRLDIVNGTVITENSTFISNFQGQLNEYSNVTLTTTNGSRVNVLNMNDNETSFNLSLTPYYNFSEQNQSLYLSVWDNLSNQRIFNYTFASVSSAGLVVLPNITNDEANFSGIARNTIVQFRRLPLSSILNLTLKTQVPTEFTDLYSEDSINYFEIGSNITNTSMNTVVQFKVAKVKLDHLNLSYDNVSLYSTVSGSTTNFEELNTVNISNVGDVVTYEANITHFSTFIISNKGAGNKSVSSGGSSSSSTGSSGGSSGGGISIPAAKKNFFTSKYYSIIDSHTFKVNSALSAFTLVTVNILEKKRLRIQVETLESNPTSINIENVYGIEKVSTTDDVSKVDLQFKVEKSWLSEKENLRLLVFDNSNWNEIDTKLVNSDDKYNYYNASSDKVGYFAIAAEKEVVISEPEPIIEEEVVEVQNETVIVAEEDEEIVEKESFSLLYLAIFILIGLILFAKSNPKIKSPIFRLPKIGFKIPKFKYKPNLPDLPRFHRPSIKLPKLSLPSLPEVKIPKIDLPKPSLPEFYPPKITLPKVKLPKFSLPSIPKFKFPKLSIPTIPEIKLPKVTLPKLNLPSLPKIKPPKFKVPSITMPKPTIPEFHPPKFKLPKLSMPAIPKFNKPKMNLPKVQKPKFSLPSLPKIKLPKLKLSSLPKVPILKLPKLSIPTIPKFKKPKLNLPSLPKIKPLPKPNMPKINLPSLSKIKTPKIKLPSIKMPKPSLPEFHPPKITLPKVKLPKFSLPSLPKFKLPKVNLPNIKFNAPSIPKISKDTVQEVVKPQQKESIPLVKLDKKKSKYNLLSNLSTKEDKIDKTLKSVEEKLSHLDETVRGQQTVTNFVHSRKQVLPTRKTTFKQRVYNENPVLDKNLGDIDSKLNDVEHTNDGQKGVFNFIKNRKTEILSKILPRKKRIIRNTPYIDNSMSKVNEKLLNLKTHENIKVNNMEDVLKLTSQLAQKRYSDDEIKNLLSNLPKDMVQNAIDYHRIDQVSYREFNSITKLEFAQLKTSIMKNLRNGHPLNLIIKKLKDAGWDESIVAKFSV